MSIVPADDFRPMVGDPDDHRPSTVWRTVADAGSADDVRADLGVILERCAPGDRIPLHRHDVDEAVIVVEGQGQYHLGGQAHAVSAGDVVFIPAGVVHGTVNDGDEVLFLHAFFPTSRVRMEMLDRNPAPGTEGQPPMVSVYDFKTGAVEVLGPSRP